MSTTTYIVGFGLRTNQSVNLNSADTALLFGDLELLISQVDGDLLFSGEGVGYWQGATEPSSSFVFTASDDDVTRDYLYSGLRDLALKFEQDAVALTWGQTRLIDQDRNVTISE